MKIKILFVLLFFRTVTFAANYSVKGKVVDNKSKQGLSYINILLKSPVDNISQGTVTDEEGEFEIKNIKQGNYTLVISGLCYDQIEKKINVTDHIQLLVPLIESTYELDQVVVTATRSERLLKDVPIATQIISGKAIEQMQLSGFRDVLEYEMPGVEFNNNGGYSNINMMGLGGKYVLFLIDGERMAGETFDNIDYDRIDMNNIEQIEIVKGASSSLYGSNAIGGVINIITKKPKEPLQVRANTRYGSNDEQQYNVSVSTLQKWGSFSLSGNYKKIDPYLLTDRKPVTEIYEDGQIIENELSKTYIAGYTNYNIAPHFTFNVGEKLNLELKGGYFYKERNLGDRDSEKVRDRFYDYTGGIKAGYKISETQHLNISANYDRYDKYEYFRLVKEENKEYENEQFRANALYDLSLAKKHSIVAGVEFLSDELMSFMFENEEESNKRNAQTYSIFTQQEWALFKELTLITGLRYDYHSRFKGHLSPRLSFMYKLNDKFTFRGGYAGGFRSPTLKELFTDWFHPYGGGFQIIGNKDMKAEVSNNFNLSAEASLGKTRITAMAQYSIIDDQVNSIWVNQDTIQYVNLGDAKVFSTEIAIMHRFNNSVSGKVTYAYVHDNLGKASIVRPHSATLRVDYTASFIPKYAPTLSFSGKYFSGVDIYRTGDVTETENTTGMDKTNTKEYKICHDAYSIWRLTLRAPLPLNFSVNAGINNLFDYKPGFFDFYSSISPGRTYYIGLAWKLK